LVMKIHALAHTLWKWHVPLLPTLLYGLNRFIFAVDLPAGTHIGRGSVLKHYGLGTVIHRRAIIGERVFINPGVVIGGRSGHKPVPVIEDDVEIGVGAKVGAGSVVVNAVTAYTSVAGIPARQVGTCSRPSSRQVATGRKPVSPPGSRVASTRALPKPPLLGSEVLG